MESLLGYRINICDLREGWRSDVRENYIVNRVMAASAHESLRSQSSTVLVHEQRSPNPGVTGDERNPIVVCLFC